MGRVKTASKTAKTISGEHATVESGFIGGIGKHTRFYHLKVDSLHDQKNEVCQPQHF